MSDPEAILSVGGCSSPEVSRHLAAYCFEDLSESERRLFEAHLLDCDFCWTEVQRLSAAVQAMRSDKELLRHLSVTDVSAVLGISAKLDWFLGGHVGHAVAASALYALGYTLILFIEVAYAFDRMAPIAWALAPAILLWSFATSFLGLALGWKAVVAGHRRGLLISTAIFTASAIVLYAMACWFLPATPITRLKIQAYTAQAAFLKGIRYLFPLAVIFIAVPFHLIVAMQRELREGRHRLALGLLSGDKWAVAPTGAFYISVRTLWVLLLAAGLISIPMMAHLLDNLIPGPYMNFFVNLLQARWVLYFGLGLECLAWYSRAVNELKRECIAVEMTST